MLYSITNRFEYRVVGETITGKVIESRSNPQGILWRFEGGYWFFVILKPISKKNRIPDFYWFVWGYVPY